MNADDLAKFAATVRVGTAWIRDETPHPDGALIHHLGLLSPITLARPMGGPVGVRLCPDGFADRAIWILDFSPTYRSDGDVGISNPFTRSECSQLLEVVERIDPVIRTWNGVGYSTFSISVAPATEAIRALVEQYRTGCERHGGSVFCGCGWFGRGFAKARIPSGWS